MAQEDIQAEITRLVTPAGHDPHVAQQKQPASDELRRYVDAQYAAHGSRKARLNVVGVNGVDYHLTDQMSEAFVADMQTLSPEDFVRKYKLVRVNEQASPRNVAEATEVAR